MKTCATKASDANGRDPVRLVNSRIRPAVGGTITRRASHAAQFALLAAALASCQPAVSRDHGFADGANGALRSAKADSSVRIAAAAYRPSAHDSVAALPYDDGLPTQQSAAGFGDAYPGRAKAARMLRIRADPASGSFLANVFINGVQITAIIDTGAQATILSARDARATGADRDVTHSETMAGIGGLTQLNVTRIRSMEVGGQELGGFSAVIGQTGIPYTLLGQTELSRLGRIVIQDGVMTIGEAVNEDGTYRR